MTKRESTKGTDNVLQNKRQKIPKEQLKMNNPEKLATYGTQDEDKQNENTTQYVLDNTICKQTQIT